MKQFEGAKYDDGKLKYSLVPPEVIDAIAVLHAYDEKCKKREVPELLRRSGNRRKGIFKCPYCGKEFEAWIDNVMQGRQHSCGCMKGEFMVESRGTHGASKTRLYRTYKHIKERCEQPNCKEYKWYGARGIKCEFETFEAFRDYALENGYRDDLTCERIDVNGNYAPGNVTFIPQSLQARNKRVNVLIEYKGLALCAAEWAEVLGVKQDTLTARIRRGWDAEKTLETPVKGRDHTPDISLVPVEIISAIRETRIYGLRKYSGSENWRSISPDRWHEALLRHVREIWEDPSHIDEESGLPSLWHIATNAAFLCACMKDKLEQRKAQSQ